MTFFLFDYDKPLVQPPLFEQDFEIDQHLDQHPLEIIEYSCESNANQFHTWINHIIFFIKRYISSFSFNSRYIWYIRYLNNLCNTSIMCCVKLR